MQAWKRILLAASLTLLSGCHWIWVKQVQLEARFVNDDNRLLNIEGSTNLPENSEMQALLSDNRGRRWAAGKGVVHKGRFYIVMDISRCPGFRTLTLDISFDPVLASARVQNDTGPRGEALAGDLIVEETDRLVVRRRTFLMLEMSQRETALRKLESGDGDIQELESMLARHPEDGEALIGLGLAYLKQRPSERHPGSKAHTFLERGLVAPKRSGRLEVEARLWIARLKADAEREKAARERLRQPDPNQLLERESLIIPGESLGIIRMGMQFRYLLRHFQLDHNIDTRLESGIETIHVIGRPDLEIKIDRATFTVVSASSDSPFFRLQNGLRVGSVMDDLRAFVPNAVAKYGEAREGKDGRLHSTGVVELEGLNVIFDKSVNPEFPLPLETIIRFEVVKPESASPAAPEPLQTPSVDATPERPSVDRPSVDAPESR